MYSRGRLDNRMSQFWKQVRYSCLMRWDRKRPPFDKASREDRCALVFVVLFFVVLGSGCSTLITRTNDDPTFTGELYHVQSLEIPEIYSGTVFSGYAGPQLFSLFAFVDLPMSFAADTILLPLTIYEQFYTGQLQKAAAKGDLKMVKALLDQGADINGTDSYRRTALMNAARTGRSEVVDLLLVKGAKVNIQSRAGRTALLYASANGHVSVVQALIDNHANVNAQDTASRNALMLAARGGHWSVVELLLENGADVKALDYKGWTALMYADRSRVYGSKEGRRRATELLRKAGASQ